MTRIEQALTLHKLTRDPLFLDAIRAIADRNTPQAIRETVESFITTQYEAYLLLFTNSGTSQPHGNDD